MYKTTIISIYWHSFIVCVTDWMHIYGISVVCRGHYLKVSDIWSTQSGTRPRSEIEKSKFFVTFLERLKQCQGQYNRLDAHLLHLRCLLRSLSKVNDKQFLRSGPHKVAAMKHTDEQTDRWTEMSIQWSSWLHTTRPITHLASRKSYLFIIGPNSYEIKLDQNWN